MEEKPKNFFKKVWTSIRDFEGYEEFAASKTVQVIKYIVLITLIFSFVIALAYTYKFYLELGKISEYIEQNVEELSLIDGKLTVKSDKEIIIENEHGALPVIIVDTSEDADEEGYLERLKAYDMGVLLLSDKAVLISNALNENQEINYKDVSDININEKSEFLDIISPEGMLSVYGAFILSIFIYLFVIYLISNLVDAVILGALGYIFARIVRLRLKYKAAFNIGIHALTLPIILNLVYIIVNTFTGFEIKYFQWMYTSISYVYVAVAILMIKTEIINQKIQLIRLKEIQNEVAKEQEDKEKEEEKKQEEKKENEKKENDKKEDKEKNKENKKSHGGEPEGSNA